jgi:hypothetical protein
MKPTTALTQPWKDFMAPNAQDTKGEDTITPVVRLKYQANDTSLGG